MSWKRWELVLLLGVLAVLGWGASDAMASTLTVVTTPVKSIVATVQEVGWYVAPLLFVGMLFHAHHQGGISLGVILEIVGVVLIVAIVVYASDIITWIRPQAAAASTGLLLVEAPLALWEVFGPQLLTWASLTLGVRYVRRARRV
jgi:hypothetical protein